MLGYGLDSDDYRKRYSQGSTWDETPYGYHLASGFFDMTWSQDKPETAASNIVRRAIKHILGFDIIHVWRNRKELFSADIVWTHTEKEHLGVGLLKLLYPRRARFKTIAQSVWLWDDWQKWSRVHRALVARLLREHEIELVLSSLNQAVSEEAVPGRAVIQIPFGTTGITVERNPDPADKRNLIISVGNDRDRDWDTMAATTRLMPTQEFRIFSASRKTRKVRWPPNVTVGAAESLADIAQAYQESTLVVLPLKYNLHASGVTVALEAASVGTPIVATNVGGIAEYIKGPGCSLVPARDPRSLAATLAHELRASDFEEIGTSMRGKRISRGLTQRDYVARYVQITRWLIDDTLPFPAGVSAFSSIPWAQVST